MRFLIRIVLGIPYGGGAERIAGDDRTHAPIAQLVELLPLKEKVPGSSPGGGTIEPFRYGYKKRGDVTPRFLLHTIPC